MIQRILSFSEMSEIGDAVVCSHFPLDYSEFWQKACIRQMRVGGKTNARTFNELRVSFETQPHFELSAFEFNPILDLVPYPFSAICLWNKMKWNLTVHTQPAGLLEDVRLMAERYTSVTQLISTPEYSSLEIRLLTHSLYFLFHFLLGRCLSVKRFSKKPVPSSGPISLAEFTLNLCDTVLTENPIQSITHRLTSLERSAVIQRPPSQVVTSAEKPSRLQTL